MKGQVLVGTSCDIQFHVFHIVVGGFEFRLPSWFLPLEDQLTLRISAEIEFDECTKIFYYYYYKRLGSFL